MRYFLAKLKTSCLVMSCLMVRSREISSMADSYNPDDLWAPFGAFSLMTIQGPGQIVNLKGQVSLDPTGAVVGAGDMRIQVDQVLKNIQAVLASVGGTMSDVTSLTHYTTDIAAFMTTGDIRNAYFSAPYPVTTTVEVAALYHPDLVIEITANAEIPRDRFQRPAGAKPMHGNG